MSEHNHQHVHHHHEEEVSKYEKTLQQYTTELDDAQVQQAVKTIIAEKTLANDTPEVKKFLFGSIELTTLSTTDSDTSVMAFVDRVNQFENAYPQLPHVAAVCVYPCFAEVASETLEVEGVEVTCVSGSFPSSQAVIEVKVAETALAVRDGATEIDIVMPVGKFLSGNYEELCDDIAELKQACGANEGYSRNWRPQNGIQHQESIPAIHVCRSRLHQDFYRQREGLGNARGRLCDVSGHQRVLRKNRHTDWL